MTSPNVISLVALSTFEKFNSKKLLKLKKHFSNLSDVWRATPTELVNAGIDEQIALEFIETRSKIIPEKEWQKLDKENIQVITIDDELYPPLLKEIYDPPALLYYRGTLNKKTTQTNLAVVGSRKASMYGKQVTEEIITPLAQAGLTIVSGLALGIDALAHTTTLKQNGNTYAILGSGVDEEHIYPIQNRQLAHQIVDNGGAVISEFPIGTLPLRYNFPIRNRIISGLCKATLIIEATEDSGSLITAKLALEQNREVYSIPGSIFSPLSYGPNNLLKMGAQVVTSAEDILHYLNLEKTPQLFPEQKIIASSAEEAAILKNLSREPKHIDLIIKESCLTSSTASSTLTMMEIKGKVRNLGGMMYILNK